MLSQKGPFKRLTSKPDRVASCGRIRSCRFGYNGDRRGGRGTMAREKVLSLTPTTILGLFYIQRYRFLTIVQFAKAAGLSRHRSEDVLRELELHGMLGHFGHVRIPGHGKTPKAYYLKRRGWELLKRESDIPDELLGTFVETHLEASWSPQMYHRLRLIDLVIALEIEVRARPHLNLARTYVE